MPKYKFKGMDISQGQRDDIVTAAILGKSGLIDSNGFKGAVVKTLLTKPSQFETDLNNYLSNSGGGNNGNVPIGPRVASAQTNRPTITTSQFNTNPQQQSSGQSRLTRRDVTPGNFGFGTGKGELFGEGGALTPDSFGRQLIDPLVGAGATVINANTQKPLAGLRIIGDVLQGKNAIDSALAPENRLSSNGITIQNAKPVISGNFGKVNFDENFKRYQANPGLEGAKAAATIGSYVAPAFIPGLQVAKPLAIGGLTLSAPLLSAVATGATRAGVAGGLQGFGQSKPGEEVAGTLIGGGLGAVVGGGIGAAGYGANQLYQKFFPKAQPALTNASNDALKALDDKVAEAKQLADTQVKTSSRPGWDPSVLTKNSLDDGLNNARLNLLGELDKSTQKEALQAMLNTVDPSDKAYSQVVTQAKLMGIDVPASKTSLIASANKPNTPLGAVGKNLNEGVVNNYARYNMNGSDLLRTATDPLTGETVPLQTAKQDIINKYTGFSGNPDTIGSKLNQAYQGAKAQLGQLTSDTPGTFDGKAAAETIRQDIIQNIPGGADVLKDKGDPLYYFINKLKGVNNNSEASLIKNQIYDELGKAYFDATNIGRSTSNSADALAKAAATINSGIKASQPELAPILNDASLLHEVARGASRGLNKGAAAVKLPVVNVPVIPGAIANTGIRAVGQGLSAIDQMLPKLSTVAGAGAKVLNSALNSPLAPVAAANVITRQTIAPAQQAPQNISIPGDFASSNPQPSTRTYSLDNGSYPTANEMASGRNPDVLREIVLRGVARGELSPVEGKAYLDLYGPSDTKQLPPAQTQKLLELNDANNAVNSLADMITQNASAAGGGVRLDSLGGVFTNQNRVQLADQLQTFNSQILPSAGLNSSSNLALNINDSADDLINKLYAIQDMINKQSQNIQTSYDLAGYNSNDLTSYLLQGQ